MRTSLAASFQLCHPAKFSRPAESNLRQLAAFLIVLVDNCVNVIIFAE
jgi:hypothetical protein